MISLTDQIGVVHHFAKVPERIISLVPSQTELLCDLNLEKYLVGITKFCVHPAHLIKTKTIIGGTKTVNIDKIQALNPDIIIANKEENTKAIVIELSKICTVWVTDVSTFDDNLKMIADFGNIFNKQPVAQQWQNKIQNAKFEFESFIKTKNNCKVAYFIWANPYMVAGASTFINELLLLNKFTNAYQNFDRYPEIELANILEPDYVFLSSEPFPFKQKQVTKIKKYTQAKIIFVDGEFFSWHGSRILKALQYFKTLQNKL